jgi:hypothetical protein
MYLIQTINGVLFALGFATITSCGLKQTEVKTISTTDMTVASFPSELRGAFIRSSTSTSKVCAEPFGDTAVQTALNLAGNISAKTDTVGSAGAKGTLDARAEIIALAGRTQAVLITRELLFRICEAQMNGALSPEQATQLFQDALKTVVSITNAEEKQADARMVLAQAEGLRARTEELQAKAEVEAQARARSFDACFSAQEACVKRASDSPDADAESKKCEETFTQCKETVRQ